MSLNSPEPEAESSEGGHPLGTAACPRRDPLLEQPGRAAQEVAVQRCCGQDMGSAWVALVPAQSLFMAKVFSAQLVHFTGRIALAGHLSSLQLSDP